jgi:hypothetical protein
MTLLDVGAVQSGNVTVVQLSEWLFWCDTEQEVGINCGFKGGGGGRTSSPITKHLAVSWQRMFSWTYSSNA